MPWLDPKGIAECHAGSKLHCAINHRERQLLIGVIVLLAQLVRVISGILVPGNPRSWTLECSKVLTILSGFGRRGTAGLTESNVMDRMATIKNREPIPGRKIEASKRLRHDCHGLCSYPTADDDDDLTEIHHGVATFR
ncbi:hypothetical protein DM02DRAFT_634950 [Periconia macrospinosa]|uniref:Uncharacterized protein n=1 Tax=Periconia macrospinosa TaxID=97972 RepID=A0A2V1D5Y8_9PLEO|nr:hypothetical protein DM02DRAFT_634950 [Periconia macrospinosa]